MATPTGGARPGRVLGAIAALTVLLYVIIFFVAPAKIGDKTVDFAGKFTPLLGLDLEGGTQIDLIPKPADGQNGVITADAMNQAVSIIRKRVNSFGVSEAEVTKQGSGGNQTILISIPGSNKNVLDLVRQTAELRFRQVLVEQPGVPAPTASPTPSAGAGTTPAVTPSPGGSSAKATLAPAPTSTTNGRAVPRALTQLPAAATATPAAGAAATSAAGTSTSAAAATPPAATPPAGSAAPTPAADDPLSQLTAAQIAAFGKLDCTNPAPQKATDAADKPLVTCGTDDGKKYILAPAALVGTDVKDASAGLQTDSQGNPTSAWEVRLSFTGKGADKFGAETARLTTLPPPRNQQAIVLDGQVVIAPTINEAIPGGTASITGQFSQKEASDLANVLKYGALPLSFEAGTAVDISPELGADSLRGGLIAGGIGLGLVVLYMLVYYRRLGLVAAASLAVAGVLSIGFVTLLGWQIGYRLSLAGIAGLIVSIGITADSFVIYFERLRDEVREGRTVRVAVETGWRRARRTIVTSDVVSLLAAVVLYFLSTASVQGFAFTLGLTTLVDLLIIFYFTKPLVTIFARSRRLTTGKWSGLDAERLGSSAGPAPSPSLALARSRERRQAAEAATTARTAGTAGEEV